MTPAELAAAEQVLSHQLDLLRLGAFSQAQAAALIDIMGRELEQLLRAGNLTEFNKVRVNRLLSQATDVIDRYYASINRITDNTLVGVADLQAGVANRAAGIVSLDAGLPTQTFLARILSTSLIEGAKSADWWGRQSKDIAFRFAAAVRQGLIQGETNEKIVARVAGTQVAPGIMTVAKSNARSLVHASIQQVANDARLETFRANSDVVKGVRQLSTLDSHTTEICIAYSGGEWDLDGEPINGTKLPFNGGPPRHWGCRSVLIPITKTLKELGIEAPELLAGRQATAGGPQRLTMKQWIDTRTPEQLAEQLGKGRAEMYLSGKITLPQLLDMKGNPLTLKQLEARYG